MKNDEGSNPENPIYDTFSSSNILPILSTVMLADFPIALRESFTYS